MLKIDRRTLVGGGALLPIGCPALAQTRAETLRFVTGGSINSLDPVMFGATRGSTGFAVNIYDTLLRFDTKPLGTGRIFDFTELRGLLAERFEVTADGLKVTLHVRASALWHDSTPITAEDVKWSLDRAISAKTMSKSQAETGSMTSPDQFRVAGDGVVEITCGSRIAWCCRTLPSLTSRCSTAASRSSTPPRKTRGPVPG